MENHTGSNKGKIMARVIAGIYELDKEIGAGGGGVVYIGRHLRLDKKIVLKADKRTLKAGVDKLRREVDLLKNLSHTYIPQVYDFVQEDGVVYTVMDYIEGESLDKMIARQHIPSQPEMIKWACQLLEALSYLHGRPPHGILHGDIKPANIMLRPNGDICLIDFNIALALGEDGAVKVGFSRGYASPEHYGADYLVSQKQKGEAEQSKNNTSDSEVTQTDTEATQVEKTLSLRGLSGVGSGVTGNSKGVMLDVRSDIYSLGATLYHLISGQRPAQDARLVEPLKSDVCSIAVAEIIRKAMAPLPENRYQTVEEMLADFRQLHKNDRRTKKHKRNMKIAVAGICCTFLTGGFSTMVGMKQLEQRQEALTLAEYSAKELEQGNVTKALQQALQAIPRTNSIWKAPVTAQAQKALTDALGVYNLAEGYQALDSINLPSAPFKVALSPQGTYFVAVYAYEAAIYSSDNLEPVAILPIQQSALSDCKFIDETHLLYAGQSGVALYDLQKKTDVWTGEQATMLAVSLDGTVVAAVNRDADYAELYSLQDGQKIKELSFYDQHMSVPVNDTFADFDYNLFALNADGSLLAVSFSNGGVYILNTEDSQKDMVLYEESDYENFSGGFCGDVLALVSQNQTESVFSMVDTGKGIYIGGYSSQDSLVIQADSQGIYLASGNTLTCINPETMTEQEIAYTEDSAIVSYRVGESNSIVATEDNAFSFYDSGAHRMSTESTTHECEFVDLAGKYALIGNRNEPTLRVMQLENHQNQQLLQYDARYEHDEARISGDWKNVMLFSNQSFRIYDMAGNVVTEVELPDSDKIYDQQFRRDENGSYLAVYWYDGKVKQYSAVSGEIVMAAQEELPDKNLQEEFCTSKYRIVSSLHQSPQVYDKKTDKFIGELESEDYLTYVTESGDYLITEYINTSGERYGLLLNDKLEKVACLPGLCDVIGNELVFDYPSGNLRHCRLYSFQELIALGDTYITK